MNVLIVDDEQLICDGVRAFLLAIEGLALHIESANSLQEANACLDNFVPDVVITDIEMPDANGLELIRIVNERYPGCHVLVLSGHDDFQYVRTAFMLHVDDYILKPMNIEKFQNIIRKMYYDLSVQNALDKSRQLFSKYYPEMETGNVSARLAEMLVYVERNISNGISLTDLENHFRCSEAFICNLFRRELGISFLEFVNRVRMQLAFKMLITDLNKSIHDISLGLGYTGERQFYRIFKEVTGITPNQLRKELKN